jgi:hypothetical protein
MTQKSRAAELAAEDTLEQRAKIEEANVLELFQVNPRARHPALLVRHDGSKDTVTITEFSRTGFRLVVGARPELGEEIHIRVVGQRDMPGRIRWAYGEEAGGSF